MRKVGKTVELKRRKRFFFQWLKIRTIICDDYENPGLQSGACRKFVEEIDNRRSRQVQ